MNTSVKPSRNAVYLAAIFLSALLMVLWSAQARAELAANVHFVSGYVAATAPGASARELAKDENVFRGDRVDTAANGRVQMRFTDGGLVSLMPGSTFTVDEYFHEGRADNDTSLVFSLLKGGLRTVTGTIGQVQHDQYELKTPVATLGIRGTEFIAVLQPANTLRVHVGRGKVVIINDQGSLEVPEGRNAVVTLGNAPELSEQGPQYQATAPAGDRLMATYQYLQDPHLTDPRANMPPPGIHSFENLPGGGAGDDTASSQPTTPSGPPGVEPPVTPPDSPSSDYLMAIALPPFAWNTLEMRSIEAEFDSATNIMTSLSPDVFDTGTWVPFDVQGDTVLSWGDFTSGSGSIAGDPINLSSSQYVPYVIGNTTVNVPSGTLQYALHGATEARSYNSDGTLVDVGTLSRFDLDINIASLEYSLNMDLSMQAGLYTAEMVSSALHGSSEGGVFRIDTLMQNSDVACGSGCPLAVEGFLAGPDANQAGIIYRVDTPDSAVISGAAALNRQ